MSHKNVSFHGASSGKEAIYSIGRIDKGLVLCNYSSELSEGQAPYITNMIYDKEMLRTRFGRMSLGITDAPHGEIHSVCENMFFGRYVFHIGSMLYSFDGTNGEVLLENLPDCDSFVFEMNSMLYFFCKDVRIFTVDKSFVACEYCIPDVKVMEEAKYNLTEYTELPVPDNMIGFRISVDYVERAAGIKSFTLPCEPDTKYPVIISSVSTGNKINIEYSVDGCVVNIDHELYSAYNVSFVPIKGSKYRDFDKIFGCTVVCTYGGKSAGGTRVFFAGNKEYPGYYFYSELLLPLEIKHFSYDILGNGSKSITALLKQKSDLIALCEKGVYRIGYTFSKDSGAEFTVSEISADAGCDIRGSARLIDNRLVFADSKSGIHIIVSSEYTDELSIRSISANINGTYKTSGFLTFDAKNTGRFVSADFDRKYFLLCPSGNAYVWDYGNSPYISSESPENAEKRLHWYLFENFFENRLFEISGALYGTREVDGKTDFMCFSEDCPTDYGEEIPCGFVSADVDFGDAFAKKVPFEFFANMFGDDEAEIAVVISFDGKPFFAQQYRFRMDMDNPEAIKHIKMRIPGYECHSVNVAVMCGGGRIGLHDWAVRLRNKRIYQR